MLTDIHMATNMDMDKNINIHIIMVMAMDIMKTKVNIYS